MASIHTIDAIFIPYLTLCLYKEQRSRRYTFEFVVTFTSVSKSLGEECGARRHSDQIQERLNYLGCWTLHSWNKMLDNAPSMLSRKAKSREPSEIPEEQTVIGESDMSPVMQAHALRIASEALDLHSVTDFKDIAGYIKKQFDKMHGPGWQCVTGISFGSYITHSSGSFIHFCVGRVAVMLFKAAT